MRGRGSFKVWMKAKARSLSGFRKRLLAASPISLSIFASLFAAPVSSCALQACSRPARATAGTPWPWSGHGPAHCFARTHP